MASTPSTEKGKSAHTQPAIPDRKMTPKPDREAGETPEPTLPNELSLYAVLRSMTFGQWAAVIGTAFTVLSTVGAGAIWVGHAIEKETREALIEVERAPLQAQLKLASGDAEVSKIENYNLKAANSAMERQMNTLLVRIRSEESFALFAEEYINYLVAPSETTQNILADYVCKLYRESQEASTNVRFVPVPIEEVIRGDFAASLDDLAASGYNVGVLKNLRQLQSEGRITQSMPELSQLIGRSVSPQPRVSPQLPYPAELREDDASEVIAHATKRIHATIGNLIKIVTFPGHSPFTMPAPVAAQVHSDPRCRIR